MGNGCELEGRMVEMDETNISPSVSIWKASLIHRRKAKSNTSLVPWKASTSRKSHLQLNDETKRTENDQININNSISESEPIRFRMRSNWRVGLAPLPPVVYTLTGRWLSEGASWMPRWSYVKPGFDYTGFICHCSVAESSLCRVWL